MNYWAIIWNAYHQTTNLNILKTLWSLGVFWKKALTAFLFVTFLGFSTAYFWSAINSELHSYIAIGVILSEVAFLWSAYLIKDNNFNEQYGFPDSFNAPAEEIDHRQNRYLVFKRTLEKKSISSKVVSDCFQLLEDRLAMQYELGKSKKIFAAFASSLLVSILVTATKDLDPETKLTIALITAMSAGVIWFFLTLSKSKVEKLTELRYFMRLYTRRSHHSLRRNF
ncbi:MAG: hypothetical protein OXT49_02505 [Gammaproteobacteria bacterium]|nr:hypothetical protein [Gammaproteobacteria bacterium]